jgi:hypothetical protein
MGRPWSDGYAHAGRVAERTKATVLKTVAPVAPRAVCAASKKGGVPTPPKGFDRKSERELRSYAIPQREVFPDTYPRVWRLTKPMLRECRALDPLGVDRADGWLSLKCGTRIPVPLLSAGWAVRTP